MTTDKLSDICSFIMGGIVVGLVAAGGWPLAALIFLAWVAPMVRRS